MDGVKITQAPDGGSILTVDTSVHDSATISVVAENSLGADESGARLVVEPKKVRVPSMKIYNMKSKREVSRVILLTFLSKRGFDFTKAILPLLHVACYAATPSLTHHRSHYSMLTSHRRISV